jgi:hypothetical protein
LFGGELISAELVGEMTATTNSGTALGSFPIEYGLGIMQLSSEPDLFGHSGRVVGADTLVAHDPTTGRTGFWVSMNGAGLDKTIAPVAALLSEG